MTFARIADYLAKWALEPERVLEWCFAQSTLSAAWHLEDGDADAQITASIATARTAERLLSA
jgi:streptomycin 6-kinase